MKSLSGPPVAGALAPHSVPSLQGARVRLRPLRPTDGASLYALFSDPVAMRFWSHPPFTEPAQAEAKLASLLAHRDDAFNWAVTAADDELLGTVALFRIDTSNLRCELGYGLRTPWQGRGFASDAVRAAISYAFDTLGLERVEADTDPRNAASRKLLEGLGFQLEGLLRARWRVAGEVCDTALYGLLRGELTARRERAGS